MAFVEKRNGQHFGYAHFGVSPSLIQHCVSSSSSSLSDVVLKEDDL